MNRNGLILTLNGRLLVLSWQQFTVQELRYGEELHSTT